MNRVVKWTDSFVNILQMASNNNWIPQRENARKVQVHSTLGPFLSLSGLVDDTVSDI